MNKEGAKFKTNSLHYQLIIGYEEKFIKEITNIKFIGIRIYNHLNWKSHRSNDS